MAGLAASMHEQDRIGIRVAPCVGDQRDVVSPEGVQDFLNLLPTAKFIDVADAGHMVAGDKNDIFTDAVVDFLGQIFTDHAAA